MTWWLAARAAPAWLCDGWEKRWPRAALIFAIAAAALLAWYLLAPVVADNWDLIDDHEIVSYLDDSPHHGPKWFVHSLLASEAGSPGGGPRYRPAYYFLRLTEIGLYGAHPIVWYGARVVMFAVAMALALWLLQSALSLAENLCLVVWFATFNWWIDIFGRLGPAETYAVFGLPLYALGVVHGLRAIRREERRARPYVTSALALFVGGMICSGTKENFVLLAPLSAFVLLRAGVTMPRRWLALAALAHGLFCVFVAVSVIIGVRRYGHVYLEDTSAAGRGLVLRHWIPRVWADSKAYVLWAFAGVMGALAVQLALRDRRRAGAIAIIAAKAALALVLLGAAYLSQVVFYNGAWPPSLGEYCCGRYGFPGLLIPATALYVGYWCVVRVLESAGVPKSLVAILRLVTVAFVALAIHKQGFPIRGQAAPWIARRRTIQRNLDSIVSNARSNPEQPLILIANAPGDFEPVVSTGLFLRHYHVSQPVYLVSHLPPPSAFPAGSTARWLAERMPEMSAHGRPPMIRPFAFHGGACLGVGFHGGLGDFPCTPVGRFF